MLELDAKKLAFNIEKRIKNDIESQEICGASVLVRQEGKLLYKNCFGVTTPNGNIPLTEDTVFRLASMTKPITGNDVLPVGCYGWSGAFGTHFWVDPENKITALYMKNAHYDGGAGAKTARNFEADVYNSIK